MEVLHRTNRLEAMEAISLPAPILLPVAILLPVSIIPHQEATNLLEAGCHLVTDHLTREAATTIND